MASRRYNIEFSSFYCPNCGNKIYDLPRQRSLIRGAFHRKKLYCPTCQGTYNSVECRNDMEAFEFKQDWADGFYEDTKEEWIEEEY